jgi:hypothetical protein
MLTAAGCLSDCFCGLLQCPKLHLEAVDLLLQLPLTLQLQVLLATCWLLLWQ